jgi:hypothetical protein
MLLRNAKAARDARRWLVERAAVAFATSREGKA